MDCAQHVVSFKDGTSTRYDKLYVATGGKPRLLQVPGADLKNIFYLRTPDDALHIREWNIKLQDFYVITLYFTIEAEIAKILRNILKIC